MTGVASGSLVIVASNVGDVELLDQSLGAYDVGPSNDIGPSCELTLGVVTGNVPAGTGWFAQGGGPWVTAALVVPPA